MYVCLCRGIREETVRELGRKGVVGSEELTGALGLDHPDNCGRCMLAIDDFVEIASIEVDPVHANVSLVDA